MTCKNCGQTNPEDVSFCTNCGAKLAPAAAPVQQPNTPVPPYQQPAAPVTPVIPSENKPLSAWAYFGYQLLFSIPLVGFVLLIVLSTGAAHNVNLRNFARSYWCALLVGVLLVLVVFILVLVLSLALGVSISDYLLPYLYS